MNLVATILLRDVNVVICVERKMGFPATGRLEHLRRCFTRRYGSEYEDQYFCADIRIRISLNNGLIPSDDLLIWAHPYNMGTRKNFMAAVKGGNVSAINYVTMQYRVGTKGVVQLLIDFITRAVRRQNYDLVTMVSFIFTRDYIDYGAPDSHDLVLVRYLNLPREQRVILVDELKSTLPPLLSREMGRNRNRTQFMTLFKTWDLVVTDNISLGSALKFNRLDLWPTCQRLLKKINNDRDRTYVLTRVAQSRNIDMIVTAMKILNVTHLDYFIIKTMLRNAVRCGHEMATRLLLTKIRNIHRRWMKQEPPSPKAEMEISRYQPFLLDLAEEAALKGHIFVLRYLMNRGRLAPTLGLASSAIDGGCVDIAAYIIPKIKINVDHLNMAAVQRQDMIRRFIFDVV